MKQYAYIRVSSKDQNVSRQIEAMQNAGILEQDMYMNKQSGKDFNREQYQLLLKKLKKGDELYVKSIDRFGWDYDEIQEQIFYSVQYYYLFQEFELSLQLARDYINSMMKFNKVLV